MENWLGLKDKVAIVTGGSSGIGAQIVNSLLDQGAMVYNVDLHGNDLERENYYSLETNVANVTEVQQAVNAVLKEQNKIDILVNNAGINLPRLLVDVKGEKPEYQMATKDLDLMFDVNLKGPVYLSQEVGKHFAEQKSGVIVNVASEAGQEGSEGQSIYAATKAALIGFTRSWAKELGKHNIRVVAIAPGILEETGLRTPAYEEALAYTRNTTVDKLNGDYSKSIPIGRVGELKEVADLVCYLSSERSSYITGTTINITGGKSRG
ncbi:SDR family oxidoreductase [Staphylococcus chromogenes]|uniref:Sorbitol-6-phosphate 2-dehydrogenase n=1 Tax=Staphylococcus chromogenes TaxID=46126 RepID=A0ABX5I663_STACR|nr:MULTISPECIES: SDR family oxidoreductase [Staphylococcus]HDS3721431.1 SDR family oxidoreductase [Staphylococcus aureus]MCE4961819.1 SDR family oxidoreductase [Staphylococcus chromogenes]MDT0740482.1 SDR family oxidoreductase [Staphylococcus chromogenes]MDU0475922.1 SDR family oxidoreductase [Staphylococcus chromogenes]PTF96610.1 sorbitol-6-phosphate 2-dehydrogenase [Staphylococcus chromogenes]